MSRDVPSGIPVSDQGVCVGGHGVVASCVCLPCAVRCFFFFLFGYAKGAHPPQQLSRVTPAAGARRLSLTNEDAYGAVV